MKMIGLLGAVLAAQTVCARMHLHGFAGDSTPLSTIGLRGDEKPGDIWNPGEPGANRLFCGMVGNNKPAAHRAVIKVGTSFKIEGGIWSAPGDSNGGTLSLSILYGSNPDFLHHESWAVGEDWTIDDPSDPDTWHLVRHLATGYEYNATLQVAYANLWGNRTYVQCIDVTVTGGWPFPDGAMPEKLDPFTAPSVDPITSWQIGPPQSLNTFQIALVVLGLAILLALLLLLWVGCKQRTSAKETSRSEPLVHVAYAESELSKLPKTAVSIDAANVDASFVTDLAANEPKNPTPAKEASQSISIQNTGSQGRHFHFRYAEDAHEISV